MNIDKVRSANGFMRTVSSIVLVTYSALVFSPAVHAMQQAQAQQTAIEQADREARSNFGLSLTRTKDVLRLLADRPDAWKGKASATDRRAAKEALRASRDQTRQLIEEVRAEFAANGVMLENKNLPEVIRQRQAEAVAQFEKEVAGFNKDLDDALAAPDDETQKSKAEAALKRLERHKLGRSQQDFDPKNLPNSALKPDRTRTPKTSVEAFQAALLTGESSVRLAQTSGFDFSHLPGADNPTYLEATTEVVLTDDIKAKSAELHNNPVEIYNWVRNNVQWQPTWGAIQDASHTLSAQRGNAFDISSLTIALFRASGIPARYVYGTIDVPEDKFRNWAGGFQNIDAAMDFASAGGIPVAAVTSGGRITKVRLEHVWVEAALDFIPSRGAKNRSADSWIAMDPSFKQVEVLQGLDIEQISGIDAAQLSQSFFASGTLNEAEGWATGLNPAILKDAQAQARSAVENYVNENLPTATVGDVIGGRRTLGHAAPVLAGTMPNKVIATGARFASVPVSLQQEITFAFGKDIEGYPIDPHSFPWARLNNKQVTLSFRPATSADENALRALLPEGEITDVSRLPASIPAYLIKVVPEIKVEGITVMSGSPSTLGTEVTFVFNPKFVSSGEKTFSYALPSGSYLAVAVVGGTVAPVALAKARESLTMMQRKLVSKDGSGVTGESFFGATYAAELLSYYAQYIAAGRYVGQKAAAFHQLAAGLGTFGFEPSVKTLFGIPRAIYGGGASMNVPIVNIVGTTTLSTTQKISFVMTLGTISSALEFGVPYQATAAATPTAFSGVSAVSAMQRALAQGQRIYHLSSANVSAVLPTLAHDGATLDEIRTAISSGKEVIVHERSISMTGWSGSGYVIFDPQTGEGAYKISGGQNGGFASYIFAFVVLMAAFAALSVFATLLISTGALALYALPTVLSAVNLVTYIMSLYTAEGDDLTVYAPWKAFLGVLLSALPFKIPAGLEADAKPFKIFLSAMNILLQCIALPGPFGVCGE